MAISNLVSPGKKMNLPGVSAFFGTQERSANDNVQKISSTMLSDSMVSSVIETLKVFTSEIGRLQETSQNIVRSFVALIKSFKNLNRDISVRFKTLSSDLTASRLDFVRNVTAMGTTGSAGKLSLEDKFPPLPGQPPKPDDPKKDNDSRFDFIDALAGLLGIKTLAKGATNTATTLARGLGMAITNPIVAGILGASGAFAAAVFASAAIGDWLEKKFGIKEKIREREATDEYKELQKTQKDASEAARNRVGETRASRNQSLGEFLQSKGLRPAGNEIKTVPGSPDLITIIKDGHPDKGKTFNFKTGEEVRPSTGTPTTPAAPAAPTIDKATESARATPDAASSASTGAGEGGAGLNVVPAGERVGSPTPAPAAPAPETAPTGAPAPASPAAGGGAAPAPAPAGAPARTSTGGEPLNTTTAQHWMLNHPEVAAAYAALSPSDKKKAAEIAASGQESEARNFVMSKGSAPKTQMSTGGAQTVQGTESQGAPAGTPAAAPAATTPPAPPETPAPPAAGGGAPVVVNNNSSQASESASNTEGDNIAGQNFPMFVVDPFVQSYIQRVTPHYQ